MRVTSMADNHTKESRSMNMSHIRSTDTKPEEIVRQFLFKKGLRYRKNDKRYPGHPDIVLPKYKTIVFVNGCFWHQHEGCSRAVLPSSNQDYWLPKLERNLMRDRENRILLESQGWRVITVWECELKKKLREETLEKLYSNIVKEEKVP